MIGVFFVWSFEPDLIFETVEKCAIPRRNTRTRLAQGLELVLVRLTYPTRRHDRLFGCRVSTSDR
jgi:hypothetical protein